VRGTYAAVFREMFSINYLNLIQIVGAIFEKTSLYILGPILLVPVFGYRMSIFTGHRPMMYELLYKNPSNCSCNDEGHIHKDTQKE
jgi:hypothetical protein